MTANKITLWKKRGWFTKEEYLYFTYGYSNDENLMDEMGKVKIMFPDCLVKSEQCDVQ